MASENETVADIVREMRDAGVDPLMLIPAFADRLEAAYKREVDVGNAAKMREAVIETQSVIAKCMDILNKIPDGCGYGGLIDDVADELCDLREEHIKAALAAPPRNCDVATEEESVESLRRTMPTEGLSDGEREIVKACINDIVRALYAPYEEGGAK